MSRTLLSMLFAATMLMAQLVLAAERPLPPSSVAKCGPIWCCDDYCPKPAPHFFCGPQKVACDDYCIKPTPCHTPPHHCKCPDDYDCKPLPCLNFRLDTRWLKCPPECASGR